jgi:3-dehydroquinate dehydratase
MSPSASRPAEWTELPLTSASTCFADENELPNGIDVIVSHYSADCTPDDDQLRQLAQRLQGAGGSIARVVTAATDVTDSLRLLALLREHAGESCHTSGSAAVAFYCHV